MNLRRLKYFLRVASDGSLSRAARHYGIAQPALTRQIQLLEAEVGARLFERLPRGLRLTEEGEFLRESLELPMNEIETAIGSVHSFSRHVKASLTIGLPPIVSRLIGGRIVMRLRKDLPNIALRITETDSNKLMSEVSRRVIDIAILVATFPEPHISPMLVLSEPLKLVGRPDLPALQRPFIRLADLEPLPLIMPSTQSGMNIILWRKTAHANMRLTPMMEIDSVDVAKQVMVQAEAYAMMPERTFREEAARGELVGIPIVDPGISLPIYWAVKPDWRLPRAVYNEVERAVFEEWYDAVAEGAWPGVYWEHDANLLSLPFRREVAAEFKAPA